jgi:parallel beta-helix repeat protein
MTFARKSRFPVLSNMLMRNNIAYFGVIIIFALTASLCATIPYHSHDVTASTEQELEVLDQNDSSQEFINSTFLENPTVESIADAVANGIPLSYYHSPKAGDLLLKDGDWTMESLQQEYPDAIEIISFENHDAFLVKKTIVIDRNATVKILNSDVLLQSFSDKDNKPSALITYGKADIVNSTIMSWDPHYNRTDPNPYHPRPFLVAKDGGIMDIETSTISYLGFSLGGALSTESALGALNYYDTSNFVVANSILAHNFYGFYSHESSNFKIMNNQVYDQIGYGLDPHTGSKDFVIDSNHIFSNGKQGIICSFRCENVTISNNIVEYNIEGIGLHWLTNSSLIKDNTVKYNKENGIFLKDNSNDNLIERNIVLGNGRGIDILENSDKNTVRGNTLVGNILAKEQVYVDDNSDSNLIYDNTEVMK